MRNLIGRNNECQELKRCMDSNRSELVIVHGRRRVGKTYLIEEFFEQKFDFKYVGAHGLRTRDQLRNFARKLSRYSNITYKPFKDWLDAFYALEDYLNTLSSKTKKVIFIDEMPWIDSGKSNFVAALENFWNGWAMSQRNIMLIATGSATSWMKNKIVANKGGLHARITCNLHLAPFTLAETEKYLESRGIDWSRYYITQAYMALGGVPFYYTLLDPNLSLAENLDYLFFGQGAQLKLEFDELYSALFGSTDTYLNIVQLLSKHKSGLTRKEIISNLGSKSSKLTKVLKNLENCDIIEQWKQFGNKKRETDYRLTDFYTLFYYKFVENNLSRNDNWWSENMNSRSVLSWQGLSFELVCMKHYRQIKEALGIRGVSTNISSWSIRPNEEIEHGAQVDMVIERADDKIHLCEMKFCDTEYDINKSEDEKLRERLRLFRSVTKTKKMVAHTYVTTYGVTKGKYKGSIHSEATMDDLFKF